MAGSAQPQGTPAHNAGTKSDNARYGAGGSAVKVLPMPQVPLRFAATFGF